MLTLLLYAIPILWLMFFLATSIAWNQNGYKYSRFTNMLGSRFNYFIHIRGGKWTTRGELKYHYKESKKNTVFIDQFRFFPEVKRKVWTFHDEKMDMFFNPKDLTKQVLFVGPPGSGKTEMILSIIKQKFYKRALIRDVKNEDYKTRYGNQVTGLICDLYDDRGAVWNIFEEKNFDTIIDLVCVNLATGADPNQKKGGNNSFFYNSAAERLKSLFEIARIHAEEKILSAWEAFDKELDKYIIAANAKDSRENKDVFNNLVLVLEVLRLWSWRAQDGSQLFTISNFFENRYNLILSGTNCAAYYTALTAAVVFENINRKTIKDDYTLYLLDEYLTMNFDEKARELLHTAIRGKGGIVFVGMQFLPAENQTTKQLLKSIWHAAFIFKTTDEETKKLVKEFFGKTTYEKQERSFGKSAFSFNLFGPRKFQVQEREVEDEFFKDAYFMEIPDYHHLTIVKNGQTSHTYLGYTPQDSKSALYEMEKSYTNLADFKRHIHIDKKVKI